MAVRCLFGQRAGQYGGWISKPGVDVYSASPGQFMLDTNSQIYQTVLKGTSNVLTLSGPGSSVPAGYVATATIVLPSEFAAFSRLIVNCNYTSTISGSGSFDEGSITSSYLKWRVISGVLVLSVVFTTASGNSSSTSNTYTYDVNWSIFRAVF